MATLHVSRPAAAPDRVIAGTTGLDSSPPGAVDLITRIRHASQIIESRSRARQRNSPSDNPRVGTEATKEDRPMSEEKPRQPLCPICRTPAGRRQENRNFPFCSDRCRMIDLGRWLGEEYAISEPLRQPPGPGEDKSM
jgi:endogenous inhibitor of DNA gyrase (YacG/DUF329 family)